MVAGNLFFSDRNNEMPRVADKKPMPPDPILIMGEVAKPGKHPLEPGAGMLDALAMAGGLTEYAHKDRVFVLRGSPRLTRIRFDFREMLRGEGPGLAFKLQPGDIILEAELLLARLRESEEGAVFPADRRQDSFT